MREHGFVRVLLAEDDDGFAAALKALLGDHAEIEVVGRACNGAEAVRLVETLRPDVLVTDVEMPGLDGIEVTRHMRDTGAPVRVVVVTGSDVEAHVWRAHEAGADAFVRKSEAAGRLVDTVLELW
jgi:DNA-binding NarL/FixJ family response regulator